MRPEAPGDIAAIHAVHTAAFPTEGEARLVDALRQGGHATISLVATIENEIVGHVLFSPVHVDSVRGLGLAPLAVRPKHQRRGVGAALVQAGLEACRIGTYACVVVLGHPDYYQRFGFRRALDVGLENEYGADEEFMVLELRPGALRGVKGLVKYSPEFSML